MKNELYELLVNQVPEIRTEYQEKRRQVSGIGRIGCWVYLLRLNCSWYLLPEGFRNERNSCKSEIKKLCDQNSESTLEILPDPKALAHKLMKFETISFDVFDTLIFRPFSKPSDLFYILGYKMKYPDYKRIREEMEETARKRKYKETGSYEVNIDDIYTIISKECGIDKVEGIENEINTEKEFCFANPYMLEVIRELDKQEKKYMVVSDMYLDRNVIELLLKKCGYPKPMASFISCDCLKSKSQGDMYDWLLKTGVKRQGWIHIGDNKISDIEQARKRGINTFYYKNVNELGNLFRCQDMSVITGSLYRGIVNAHLYNGLCHYSRFYEYGYIYGGLFIVGYCQFIHQYVANHNVDKILFLARDGDILRKAWEILYPDEMDQIAYVYWSRIAATKMASSRFKYDFFRRFLYHKVNQDYTLADVLKTMDLTWMLENICKENNMQAKTILTDKNVDGIKAYLQKNWEYILNSYKEQVDAGKEYFKPIVENSRAVVVVDIGWAGSGAITLTYLFKEIWNFDCDVTGIIAGTNTANNAEPDSSETFLKSGELISYMYSQEKNRDLWKFHNPNKKHNLLWEALMSSYNGSFRGFYSDHTGKIKCRLNAPPKNRESIRRIQRGIIDFVKAYKKMTHNIPELRTVSGRDAYAPMQLLEQNENTEFIKIIEEILDETNVV